MNEIIVELIRGLALPVIVGIILFIIISKLSNLGKKPKGEPTNKKRIREMVKDELELYSDFLGKVQKHVRPKYGSILQFRKFPELERLLSPAKPTMKIIYYDSLSIQDKAAYFTKNELKDIENAYESVRKYGFHWDGLWETGIDQSLELKSKVDKAIEHF